MVSFQCLLVVWLADRAGLDRHTVAWEQVGALAEYLAHQLGIVTSDAPLAVGLHATGLTVLIPVIDDALRKELNKLTHIVFSFQKYKEDTQSGILSITMIVGLAYQRTSKAVAGSSCQGSPATSQGGVSSVGFD